MPLSVLGAGLVLAGCAGRGTPSQQVRAWAAASGWDATLRQLQGDLAKVAALGPDSASPARRTLCDVLVTDALAANEQLPTPDDRFTRLLSGAYTSAATAGHHCFSGGDGLAEAPAEARGAARTLLEADARYDELVSSLPAP
ncbi:MAG: hypothetical protein KGJ77_08865 [Acidobacteriota bacterium]|nr:hypothetical protein [Acidobacteriota bacterium]